MSLLVQNFRKTVSKSKDVRIKSEAEFGVGYSTGYLVFDFMNGTKVEVTKQDGSKFVYNSIGIVDGTMISCVGRSGCGKTTFVMQASGNIIRPFPNSAIFHEDIEGGITDMRKRQLLKMSGDDFKSRYICRNTGITTENFFERIKMIHDIKLENRADYEYDTGMYDTEGERIYKLQPTVVILDSLAMLMPESLTEKTELAGGMAATSTAKSNTQLVKSVIPMLKTANIIFFVINHLLAEVSLLPKKAQVAWMKQGERCPGGETPIYLSNNILRFDDNSKLKSEDTFGINGIYVDILLVKSRTNNAGKSVKMVFDYATGFDPELSLFMLLKDQGLVNGAGVGLYLQDRNDMKFSQKKFKDMLNNPEFLQIFMEESFKALDILLCPVQNEVTKELDVDTSSIMLQMMREKIGA